MVHCIVIIMVVRVMLRVMVKMKMKVGMVSESGVGVCIEDEGEGAIDSVLLECRVRELKVCTRRISQLTESECLCLLKSCLLHAQHLVWQVCYQLDLSQSYRVVLAGLAQFLR